MTILLRDTKTDITHEILHFARICPRLHLLNKVLLGLPRNKVKSLREMGPDSKTAHDLPD